MKPIKSFLTRFTSPATNQASELTSAPSSRNKQPGQIDSGVTPQAQRSAVIKTSSIALLEPRAFIRKLPVEVLQNVYKELAPKDFISFSQSRLFLSEASKSKKILELAVEKSGNRNNLENLDTETLYGLLSRSVLLHQQYAIGPRRVTRITTHSGNTVRPASFSPDSRFYVSTALFKSTAHIWDLSKSRPSSVTLHGHTSFTNHASFSPDGRSVVTASRDGTARVWDPSQSPPTYVTLRDWFYCDYALFSPNSRFVLTQCFSQPVKIWDLSQTPPSSVSLGRDSLRVSFDAFSADSRYVVTRDRNLPVVWDLSHTPPTSFYLPADTGYLDFTMFSPTNGCIVAAGSDRSTVEVFDLNQTPITRAVFSGHSDVIRSVSFSPDSRFLATGSDDHTARVWDLSQTPLTTIELKGHTDSVTSVSFSPDSLFLLTASPDGTKIWDFMQTPPTAVELRGKSKGLATASFSPNGRFVVTANNDSKTTNIWDFQPESSDSSSTALSLHRRLDRFMNIK